MDQMDTGIQSVIKALTTSIAPAIDPNDPLAKEQVKLAVSYLEFVRKRLDYMHARERHDLLHYIALADELLNSGKADKWAGKSELGSLLEAAKPVAANPATTTDVLRKTTMELAHSVATLVQDAAEMAERTRDAIRKVVIDHTERNLDFERLWYAPLGFDPSPPEESQLATHFK